MDQRSVSAGDGESSVSASQTGIEPAAPMALAGFFLCRGSHGVLLEYHDGTLKKWASGALLRMPWYSALRARKREQIEAWHAHQSGRHERCGGARACRDGAAHMRFGAFTR